MKPNILFLLTDDQRYNTINALGNEFIKTPNLDKLVANGTAFTNAHIPSGTSGAVCMPSRAMLNTGRTLFNIYKEGQEIDKNHSILGETLKNDGYNTIGIGKWHNGTQSYYRSFCDGDNIFFGGMWDHWNVPVCEFDKSGRYEAYKNFSTSAFNSNNVAKMNCDKVNVGIHSTELFSDTAMEFLEKIKDDDKPFFMYVSYLAPHDPRTMPDEFKNIYNPEELPLPENFLEKHSFDIKLSGMRDEDLASYPRKKEEVLRHLADYYSMISHLDYKIGQIIDKLKETNQYENTIIVFCADNGLAVGSHGLMGKQNLYEHSVRVPLIMSGPGIAKDRIVENYVYLLDIFPTLLDLISISKPESVQGISFKKMIDDITYITRESLYFAYTDISRAIKTKKYKLIVYNNEINKQQLFDLENDPYETSDLINDNNYQDIKNDLLDLFITHSYEWEINNKSVDELSIFTKNFFNLNSKGGE